MNSQNKEAGRFIFLLYFYLIFPFDFYGQGQGRGRSQQFLFDICNLDLKHTHVPLHMTTY